MSVFHMFWSTFTEQVDREEEHPAFLRNKIWKLPNGCYSNWIAANKDSATRGKVHLYYIGRFELDECELVLWKHLDINFLEHNKKIVETEKTVFHHAV